MYETARLLGGGMEFFQGDYANPPLYRDMRQLGKGAVQCACGKAGVTPQDIDVFSIYDPVSFEVMRQFEMLGLCGEGEGGAFSEGGRWTSVASARPTSTAACSAAAGREPVS